jgi:hypothetical protein
MGAILSIIAGVIVFLAPSAIATQMFGSASALALTAGLVLLVGAAKAGALRPLAVLLLIALGLAVALAAR